MEIQSFIDELEKNEKDKVKIELNVNINETKINNEKSNFITVLKQSILILEEAIIKYNGSLAISFNGGKDACVAFHLLRYVLYKLEKSSLLSPSSSLSSTSENKINIIYFYDDNEFSEITEFINEIKDKYGLNYNIYKYSSMIVGLQEEVNNGVKAIIMGLRKGDPYSEEAVYFDPSTKGWPPFMRVNPILNWTYEHIWEFLIKAKLSYCKLYDYGYTSLGNVNNTQKNPALEIKDSISGDIIGYLPAFQLEDYQLERDSRIIKPS
jgi:FAD synthetase